MFGPKKDQDNLVNDLWLKISENSKISLNFVNCNKSCHEMFSVGQTIMFYYC